MAVLVNLLKARCFMKSTSNDINDTGSNKVKDKDYYIAVPIRCIKE